MNRNELDIGVPELVIPGDTHLTCERRRVDLEESLSRAGLGAFRRI